MKCLLLLFSCGAFAQQLHHQMISSQGNTNTLSNGMTVRSTVGQSVTGTSQKQYVIQQGFQQSYWGKYIATDNKTTSITTTIYPNPYIETVNFKFSAFVADKIAISVFDIAGRLVASENMISNNNQTSIDLSNLPIAEYLVKLSANNFEYYTKIIKK